MGTFVMAYGQTFYQIGSTGPVVWSISAGTLPSGMTLNATSGVLAGIPAVTGSFPFTVRATNGGCLGEHAYTLVVKRMTTMDIFVTPNPVEAGSPWSWRLSQDLRGRHADRDRELQHNRDHDRQPEPEPECQHP